MGRRQAERQGRQKLDTLPLIAIVILCQATGSSACGGLFTSPEGVITSPGYPSPYPNNQECLFVIKREKGEQIILTFSDLEVEDEDSCSFDSLVIHEGETGKGGLRRTMCGSELPQPIRSFSNTLWLRFESDESKTAAGFKAQYSTVPASQLFYMLAAPQKIMMMHDDNDGGSMAVPLGGVYNPVAVDYDPGQDRLYWADEGIREVRSAFLNGTGVETLLTTDDEIVFGLVLDPISRLLFFVELPKGEIRMFSVMTRKQKTVLVGLVNPVSIAIDHSAGYLFWLEKRPITGSRIGRANYDGTSPDIIVRRHLVSPEALAVDSRNRRLYWVDSSTQKIEWTDYKGRGRSSQVAKYVNTHFFSLAVTQHHLQIIDWGSRGERSLYTVIRQMDKEGGNHSVTGSYLDRIRAIQVHDAGVWDTVSSGCRANNGGCSHFCVPTPTEGHRCLCPDLYVLHTDRKTCLLPTPPRWPSGDAIGDDDSWDDGWDDDWDDEDEDDDEDEPEDLTKLGGSAKPVGTPNQPTRNPDNLYVISKDDQAYRPRTAEVHLTGPRPFDTDGSKVMTLTCEFEGAPIIVWTNSRCKTVGSGKCIMKPVVPDDDGSVVTCEVYYGDNRYGSSSFQLRLNYPPTSPPSITGYWTGKVLKAGNSLTMTCKVKGGKPLVSSVDFYCRGHPDTEPDEETLTGVQAVVTIPRLTSAHHGMTCVCSAEWKVPEMYTHKAYVTLTVVTGDVGSKDVGRKNEL